MRADEIPGFPGKTATDIIVDALRTHVGSGNNPTRDVIVTFILAKHQEEVQADLLQHLNESSLMKIRNGMVQAFQQRAMRRMERREL